RSRHPEPMRPRKRPRGVEGSWLHPPAFPRRSTDASIPRSALDRLLLGMTVSWKHVGHFRLDAPLSGLSRLKCPLREVSVQSALVADSRCGCGKTGHKGRFYAEAFHMTNKA